MVCSEASVFLLPSSCRSSFGVAKKYLNSSETKEKQCAREAASLQTHLQKHYCRRHLDSLTHSIKDVLRPGLVPEVLK